MSSLGNAAFRRYAPDRIAKNIHQVWIGDEEPSDFRMKLHETIKSANPGYEVYLWRPENLTYEEFPLTYALI